jgi:uncharacterized protein YndB with AHSA1/START domain
MATVVEIKPAHDRELVIARRLKATPAALFRCWTDPKLIPEWFCPKPWRAEVHSMDVRPGGATRMTFHGPDGEAFPNNGVYLEVVPGKKLVFTDAYDADWVPNPNMMFTGVLTFEDAGNGETLYVARALHWADEAAKRHEEMGFHQGWGIVAEQLEAMAQKL